MFGDWADTESSVPCCLARSAFAWMLKQFSRHPLYRLYQLCLDRHRVFPSDLQVLSQARPADREQWFEEGIRPMLK
jgi:hypothetical protein